MRRSKRQRGLKVVWRDDWAHAHGTVRANGRSIRVRTGLGVHRSQPQAQELAEAERFRIEQEARGQASGKKPLGSFAEAVRDFLGQPREQPLGQTSLDIVDELLKGLGIRPLEELLLKPALIDDFYEKRYPPRVVRVKAPNGRWREDLKPVAVSTIKRHQNILNAILYTRLKELPEYRRAAPPKKKGSGVAKKLPPLIVTLLVDCLAAHLRAPVAVMFATGARVAMTMASERTDFVLPVGQSRIIFSRHTKNGRVYDRRLHEWAAQYVRESFLARADNFKEAFLTQKHVPYKTIRGGIIKTGWRLGKERLKERLAKMGQQEWIALGGEGYGRPGDWIAYLDKVTPHWARHNWANAMRNLGFDKTAITTGGMWADDRVVGDVYMVEDGNSIGDAAADLPFGFPPAKSDSKKKA